MLILSRRAVAETGKSFLRSPSTARCKSTTSSIKAGLRAEAPRGRTSRSGATFSRDRSRPSTGRFGRDIDRRRTTPDRSSQEASPKGYVKTVRGPKVPTDEEVFEGGDDAGPPLSRQERRAKFWEEKQLTQNEEEDEEPIRDVRPRHRRQEEEEDDDDVPPPIPYTTASSQFIYGSNAVLAALRAESRKMYKLWMHRKSRSEDAADIRRTAQTLGIQLIRTQDDELLDRLSDGRPHNGIVLEVSPLPARPVNGLSRWLSKTGIFKLDIATQTQEEKDVNGEEDTMRTRPPQRPLIVFVDGITDEGNLGNIIRTAHFFGADAVAIATNTCAPFSSPIVVKASAGACEVMPIFNVKTPGSFIFTSRRNGWKIYAAVAPKETEDPALRGRKQFTDTFRMATDVGVTESPAILMLGAEGEGLRDNLKLKADVLVTIPSAPKRADGEGVDAGVDSINVASAAAVLINAFKSAWFHRRKLNTERKDRKMKRKEAFEFVERDAAAEEHADENDGSSLDDSLQEALSETFSDSEPSVEEQARPA